MSKSKPRHGFCTICKGPIETGVSWTLTGMMNRIHADPDDCIAILRPVPAVTRQVVAQVDRPAEKPRQQVAPRELTYVRDEDEYAGGGGGGED